MRGFLVGSLALIVLSTLLQARGANAAVASTNVAANGLRRALSGDVAAIPQKAGAIGYWHQPSSTTVPAPGTTTPAPGTRTV